MRLTDPVPGIIFEVQSISPEVERAQRLAELKDIAEYRQRHLKYIQEWSDPIKRAAKQAQYAKELEEAKIIFATQIAEDAKRWEMHKPLDKDRFAQYVAIRMLGKPPVKLKWYQKILAWFRG